MKNRDIPIPRTRNGDIIDSTKFNEVVQQWHKGIITAREAYRTLNIAERTFYTYLEKAGLIKTRKPPKNMVYISEAEYKRLKKAAGEA